MNNTRDSFRDKWENNQDLAFSETLRERSDISNWILNRNGFGNMAALSSHLAGRRRILDAGCGNGRVTALLRKCSNSQSTQVVGVDLVAAHIAQRNLEQRGLAAQTAFFERDLLGNLSDLGQFDFIYCQEVLHHTTNPEKAFSNLCNLLLPGGEIAIYVYKKKAPAREFVDDYVRERISGLAYEQALHACRQITELGRALTEQNVKLKIPAVEVLEIPAGEYDMQRFIYHFFSKCFWNPDLSFDENVAINYDWYHPQLCSRHSLEEIRAWFERAKIRIVHEHVDFYGITVRGTLAPE